MSEAGPTSPCTVVWPDGTLCFTHDIADSDYEYQFRVIPQQLNAYVARRLHVTNQFIVHLSSDEVDEISALTVDKASTDYNSAQRALGAAEMSLTAAERALEVATGRVSVAKFAASRAEYILHAVSLNKD